MARAKSSGKLTPKKKIPRWTPNRQARFLKVLAQGHTVISAAKAVGMSSRTAYELRKKNEAFAKAWQVAYDDSTKLLEAECFRRASGWEEVVIDKEGNAHVVRKHSDLLMMFLLKARKPMYRDRVAVDVNDRRDIVVNLLPVERGPSGKLRLVGDIATVPLLGTGEEGEGEPS